MLTFGELFAGIGGFSLGFERSGMQCRWHVENDRFCQSILERHWPGIGCWDDVRTFPPNPIEDWYADVLCGGFPCQDISFAGAGAGLDGERSGLWFEFLRVIRTLHPRFVVVENVAALLGQGLGVVLGGLAESGYDAEWRCISASDFGAPHRRERIWIIAYANGERRPRLVAGKDIGSAGPWGWDCERDLQTVIGAPFERGDRWPQPLLRSMDDGIPNRMARTKCAGNSLVPQISEFIGRRIIESTR